MAGPRKDGAGDVIPGRDKEENLTSKNLKVGSWDKNWKLVGKWKIGGYMQKQKTINVLAESRK